MNVLFSINTIRDQGGISSSALNLLNYLYEEKHNITLCVLSGNLAKGITIPNGIKIVYPSNFYHDCFFSRNNFYQLGNIGKCRCYIRKFIKKVFGVELVIKYAVNNVCINEEYDVAIAFYSDTYKNGRLMIGGDFKLVADRIKARQKIAWIHNDAVKLGYTYEICKKIFYKYDGIINVSSDGKRIFDQIIPEYSCKSYLIYNLYNIKDILSKSHEPIVFNKEKSIRFITVCRLSENQKRVSRILKTCKRLLSLGYNDFEWVIIGDGPHKLDYETFVKMNNLSDLIKIIGLKPNPYPYIKSADAFVLSSLYEGLPVTVREAQILECPPLVTDFGSSHEAIQNGINGIICENSEEGLFRMIKGVIDDSSILVRLRQNLKSCPVNNDLSIIQLKKVCKL